MKNLRWRSNTKPGFRFGVFHLSTGIFSGHGIKQTTNHPAITMGPLWDPGISWAQDMLLAVMGAYPGNNSFMLRVEYGTLCRQYFGRRVAIFCQGQVGLEGPRCAIGKETRQGTTSAPWRW